MRIFNYWNKLTNVFNGVIWALYGLITFQPLARSSDEPLFHKDFIDDTVDFLNTEPLYGQVKEYKGMVYNHQGFSKDHNNQNYSMGGFMEPNEFKINWLFLLFVIIFLIGLLSILY